MGSNATGEVVGFADDDPGVVGEGVVGAEAVEPADYVCGEVLVLVNGQRAVVASSVGG